MSANQQSRQRRPLFLIMRAGAKLPYVVAGVKDLQLAVSAAYVREITRTPPWHEVPNAPPYLRGVINLRGKVLPLVDLRLRLGFSSALEEVEAMIAMLVAREQDHVRWLQELLAAVNDGRPFTLARDPSQCAFGKWYHSYHPKDIGFASVMRRLELPHQRIHTLADAVLKCAEQGNHAQARAMIQHAEQGDLRAVVSLFTEARTAFRESQKEVTLVLTDGRKHLALAVDTVASVEPLAEDTIADAPAEMNGANSDLLRQVAHRANGKGIVFLLDAQALLAHHCQQTP
jgi:purine-binding chemotaxis protein CheW